MEQISEENDVFSITGEEALSNVFTQLKFYCLDLLELLQNPKKNVTTISELLEFLRRTPADALQPFLNYTLFPLLLLLDAAIDCRSQRKAENQEQFGIANTPVLSPKISDRFAEALLLSLEELLNKCHLGYINQVGTADALSFFLPGVVSKISKVLHVSKIMISGAAGSVGATDQALRGLAEFLMIVLEDQANLSAQRTSVTDFGGFHPNKDTSTKSILEALHHLPINSQVQHGLLAGDSNGQAVNIVTPKLGSREKNNKSLYVNRTKDWLEETSAHVDKLLCATFPQLCVHPAKKARKGVLDAIRGLLSKCSYTLKKSRLMLLIAGFCLVVIILI